MVPWEATTVSTCTADPTSTPVPTTTAKPTAPPVEVGTATELNDAVVGAASGHNIVVTAAAVALEGRLVFPVGLADVALRGERGGRTTLQGDGSFMLIWVKRTRLTLEDLVLTGGYSSTSGGAVFVYEGVLWARRCTLSDKSALKNGGAILIQQSTAAIEDSTFDHNTAVEGSGGAMRVYFDSMATFLRTIFTDNVAGARGGAVSFDLNEPSYTDPSLMEDCRVASNTATTGGRHRCYRPSDHRRGPHHPL